MTENNDTLKHSGSRWLISATMFVIILTAVFHWYNVKYGFSAMLNVAAPFALLTVGLMLSGRVYRARIEYLLGLAFVLWYILTRALNGDPLLDNARYNAAFLCMAMCVALPFSGALSQRNRHRVLTAIGVLLVGVLAVIAWLSVFAVVTRQSLQLPLASFPIELDTEMRLQVWQTHANITGGLFSAACLIALYHLASLKRKGWLVLPVTVACLGFYLAVGLTVSRTSMACLALFLGIAASLMVARFFRQRPKTIRWVALPLIALVVALGAYKGFGVANEAITALSNRWIASREAAQTVTMESATPNSGLQQPAITITPTVSVENATPHPADAATTVLPSDPIQSTDTLVTKRGLLDNWWTLNGRTEIYAATLRAAVANPRTLLTGNLDGEFMDWVNQTLPAPFAHTHNAVLQTLMTTGLVGAGLMVWFLVRLLKHAWRVFWHRKSETADRLLVLIPLAILADAMMEPLIFNYYDLVNLLFFLYSGMMIESAARLRGESALPMTDKR